MTIYRINRITDQPITPRGKIIYQINQIITLFRLCDVSGVDLFAR